MELLCSQSFQAGRLHWANSNTKCRACLKCPASFQPYSLLFWKKIFTVFVITLFLFWFFGQEACRILAPRPGIEPTLPTLEGEVLTIGPPGKSPDFYFFESYSSSKPPSSRKPSWIIQIFNYFSPISSLIILTVCIVHSASINYYFRKYTYISYMYM